MREMTAGYVGKILEVDLTKESIKTAPINIDIAQRFVGGKGYAARLLWEHTKPSVEPLGPDNIVIFATGPLTATSCPSTRMCIATKSPLTGTFNDAYVGGHFGAELKFAGYDIVEIKGSSKQPTYLMIGDDNVELRDASGIWGKDTFATEDRIRAECEDESVRVACIGPAGEKLVRYAVVNVDRYRQAARGGVGTVMGSKKLKAVAVRGTGEVKVSDPDTFAKLSAEASKSIEADEGLYTMKRWGTGRSVLFSSDQDLYPTRNFQTGTFEHAENLSGEAMEKGFWVKSRACFGCPIHCGHLGVTRSSEYPQAVVEGVEYETTTLIGANCCVPSLDAVAYANMLCDKYGLDTLSTGNAIAWAMECFEKGIINENMTDGLKLQFGSDKALIEMIERIAARKGLGDVLGEGVKRASAKVGKGSDAFAMHVKGLELPGWGIRASPGMGLAYATADRGGCHQRAWPIAYEVKGAKGPDGELVDRYGPEGKALVTKSDQDGNATLFSLVACDFATGATGWNRYLGMLNAATGMKMTASEFSLLGERIWNQIRAFNVREGFSRKDDTLPPRIFNEPLTSGIAKGKALPKSDFEKMLDDYYRLRAWDVKTGYPTEQTLKRLGLEDVSRSLDGLGLLRPG